VRDRVEGNDEPEARQVATTLLFTCPLPHNSQELCALAGNWVDGQCIDAVLSHVAAAFQWTFGKHDVQNLGNGVIILSEYFRTALAKRDGVSASGKSFQLYDPHDWCAGTDRSVLCITVFVNHVYLFDEHVKRVVFPCNIGRMHWYACVMDFESSVVYVHDPLGGEPSDMQALAADIRYFLQAHARSCVEEFHREHVDAVIQSINGWQFQIASESTPKQVRCAVVLVLGAGM
jgi:hypothetical protein